jgi:hypothetical protein
MGLYICNTWEYFETCCWRRTEKIVWNDRVRNEEVLRRIKEERNILHTIQRRMAKGIGYILHRNYLLKHVIEGMIEGSIDVVG